MSKVVWIVQKTDTVTDWFLGIWGRSAELVGTRKDRLRWYESSIANYVAHHADRFSEDGCANIWFELDSGDPRTVTRLAGRIKPDLILEFPRDLWLIEVKYEDNAPKPGTSVVSDVENQLHEYENHVRWLQSKGWMSGKTLRLAVFWVYRNERKRATVNEKELAIWPIER